MAEATEMQKIVQAGKSLLLTIMILQTLTENFITQLTLIIHRKVICSCGFPSSSDYEHNHHQETPLS
jgi:hypothetical protein